MKPSWHDDALEAVRNRRARVAVVGCGYVGLSVALEAAAAGFTVFGVEADEARAKELAAGNNPVPDVDVPAGELDRLRDEGRLRFSDRLSQSADVFVLCVPTPLRDGTPDLHFIEAAGESVARVLRLGSVVVLESTTYPGTTEEFLRPILEEGSGLVAGESFSLAHSPERIDPGNPEWGLRNTPKVVGGLSAPCTELAAAFYRSMCQHVVELSSPRAAEMTKLLENTYRHVNIALVNEMAMICQEVEIDPWEVIGAAATKPFGFVPFRPGPGVGGHCIPVDPQYLAWRVRGRLGHQFRLLETADDVNQRMPAHVALRAGEILNDAGKALRGARVLVLGVAFKGGSADVRESPALKVMERLLRSGAELEYHDAYVPQVTLGDRLFESVDLSDDQLRDADLVLVLTDHPGVDYAQVCRTAERVFDTRGVTWGLGLPHGAVVHRS